MLRKTSPPLLSGYKKHPCIQVQGCCLASGLSAPRPSNFSTPLCREYKLFVKQLKYVKSTVVRSTHQHSLINQTILHVLGLLVNVPSGCVDDTNRGRFVGICLFFAGE